MDIINGATPLELDLSTARPRLYFDQARLDELRARAAQDGDSRAMANLRASAERGKILSRVLLALLTENTDALADAKALLLNTVAELGDDYPAAGAWHDLAVSYDWLHGALSAEERQQIATTLDRVGREMFRRLASYESYESNCVAWNVSMHIFADCATVGLSLYGDVDDIGPWLRYTTERCRSIGLALGDDGLSAEGNTYGGFFNDYYIRLLRLVKDLLGQDFFDGNTYLQNVPIAAAYSIVPRDHLTRGNAHWFFGDGIIVSSDHGENLGELGCCAEHATADHVTCRVPLIVRWPGAVAAGTRTDGLHYNIDLAPTLADMSGFDAQPFWDGRSFADTLRDGTDTGRDELILSQCSHGLQRSVRWDDWIYIRTYHDFYHLWPDEMLFNIKDDPHEQNNLAPERPDLCKEAVYRYLAWHDDMMRTSPSDADPLWTVMREGGPFHAFGDLPAYCKRLEDTGRGWAVEELKRRHPERFRSE